MHDHENGCHAHSVTQWSKRDPVPPFKYLAEKLNKAKFPVIPRRKCVTLHSESDKILKKKKYMYHHHHEFPVLYTGKKI